MKTKTFYYAIYDDGRLGERFNTLETAQASIATSGVPHHVNFFLAQTFDVDCCGLFINPRASYMPNWFQHWRLLELAKASNPTGALEEK